MQLILNIDDIGIEKNMSSGEEANQNDKKIKTDLIDSNVSSSPSLSNIIKEDSEKCNKNVNCNQNIEEEISENGSPNEKSSEVDNSHNLSSKITPMEDEDTLDISTYAVETENEDKVVQQKCSNKTKETISAFFCNGEENCDKINDSDENMSVKSEPLNDVEECQEEHVVNTIKEENETMISSDDEIKDDSSKYKKVCNESELSVSSTDVLETNVDTKANEDSHENGVTDKVSSPDVNEVVEESQTNDMETEVINNVVSENIENPKTDIFECKPHEETNDEVIDIADEKESPDSKEIENNVEESRMDNLDRNEEPTKNNKEDSVCQSADDLKHNTKESTPITIDEEIIDIADDKDSCDGIKENSQDSKILKDQPELKNSHEHTQNKTPETSENVCDNVPDTKDCNDISTKVAELKPIEKVNTYKLSNTLDILSDDEEENTPNKQDSPKPKQDSETNEKQCINVEEDDDIMVIDDESTIKQETNVPEEKKTSNEVKSIIAGKESNENTTDTKLKAQPKTDIDDLQKSSESKPDICKPNITKATFPRNALLSSTTLKSFKKNLGEMTREELEDFCILTIAEAVFDRSNLGELKSQLKILNQNLEDHKSKAKSLAKQNRDLQVVLKSVQEEQKKNSETPITPLKITRSVGMQVLMADKSTRKRQAVLTAQIAQNTSPLKTQTAPTTRAQNKATASPKTPLRQPQQQIPVPRLVPAVSPVTKPTPASSPLVSNGKSPANNVPNGVKTPPVKPEKRTHNKMQQQAPGAFTVDLTDDEPPPKVQTRNFNSPVRCVPPQSLMARPPAAVNSPRKVYIPISGQQAQSIRPGQHIMLKSVSAVTGVGRPRGPLKATPNATGTGRGPRIAHRHPAPLPEFMKQYQPPNWKALPPAPDIKLAKVENGIVISWKIDDYREENYEDIASYQLFAYQETSQPPNTSLWKKIGDVKALPLPMACTLTQFMSGYKYYFAVRAVDVKSRFGPFSLPGSILLLKS